MFCYEPQLIQYLDASGITSNLRATIGDIRQPWLDIGSQLHISPFAAKALFALGMMRRYVLAANAVLKDLGHLGFLSACGLMGSAAELLGRCVHPAPRTRQDPVSCSMDRLTEGFNYAQRTHLPSGIVIETNHYTVQNGGYHAQDLVNLRNLAAHGGCLTRASQIKGDIEMLHELRKAFYGIPAGETDPHEGPGPIQGAIDRYYGVLASGDHEMCNRLASAGISPVPLSLQQGDWPFDVRVVSETHDLIDANLQQGRPPISGGHTKVLDFFRLYEIDR